MFKFIQFLHYIDDKLSCENKMPIDTPDNTNISRYFLTLSQQEKEVFIVRQAMVLAYLNFITGNNIGLSFKTYYEELRKLSKSHINSTTAKVISERLFGWYGQNYQDQNNFNMQSSVEEYMTGYPHLPGKMPKSVWVPFYLFSLMTKSQPELDIPLSQLALPVLSETYRTQIVQGQGSERFHFNTDHTKIECISVINFAASFVPKSNNPIDFLIRLTRTAGSEETPNCLHLLQNIIRSSKEVQHGPKYGSLGLKGSYFMNITSIEQVFKYLCHYRDQGILADTKESRCIIDNYITALGVRFGYDNDTWSRLNEQARSLDLLPKGTTVPVNNQVRTALETFHSAFLENEKLYDPDTDEPLPPEIHMEAEEEEEPAPEETTGEEEEGGDELAEDDTAGDGESEGGDSEEETKEEQTISRTQASIAERVKSILGFSPKIAKTTTMSDVMFRDMVGKRVDAILDQQPHDFSANELDLLKHLRLHWLYLVDLENLVILLERLFAGKTTTLQG